MLTTALTTRAPITLGTWTLVARQSKATFTARSLFGLVKVTGEIPIAEATISVTEMIAMISVSAALDPAGINTGKPKRDKHLGDVVLEAANHPRLYFRAQGVAPSKYGWQADADLIVSGNSAPIQLDVRLVELLDGGISLRAKATLRRKDYGLKVKRLVVRDKVDVNIVARFRRV
jgi:polyisoprenoid-binding protein YceI